MHGSRIESCDTLQMSMVLKSFVFERLVQTSCEDELACISCCSHITWITCMGVVFGA